MGTPQVSSLTSEKLRPVNSIRLFSVWPVFELDLHAVSLDFLNFFVSPPSAWSYSAVFQLLASGQNGEFLFSSFSRYLDSYPRDF